MKDQKNRRVTPHRLALANDFGGLPPGGTNRAAAGSQPRRPTLTEAFNAAAQQTPELSTLANAAVTKTQIEALRRKMSQPRPTLDYGTMGSVNNARNPERDRLLLQAMAALKERLQKQRGLKERFALVAKQGELKQSFNRASSGRGM